MRDKLRGERDKLAAERDKRYREQDNFQFERDKPKEKGGRSGKRINYRMWNNGALHRTIGSMGRDVG